MLQQICNEKPDSVAYIQFVCNNICGVPFTTWTVAIITGDDKPQHRTNHTTKFKIQHPNHCERETNRDNDDVYTTKRKMSKHFFDTHVSVIHGGKKEKTFDFSFMCSCLKKIIVYLPPAFYQACLTNFLHF